MWRQGREAEVLADIDRDRFMTAAEGVEYGLIDLVMTQGSTRVAA